MHDRQDIINGEWLAGMSELERLMIEDYLHLDLGLTNSTAILGILQKFPDPTLRGPIMVIKVELIQAIHDLFC
jgi:hypothetical protein